MKQLLVTSIVWLIASMALAGEGTDWKKGKLEHLASYIGTYHYEKVLNDPFVTTQLSNMLTTAQLKHLNDNLSVKAPISLEADCIVLKGNLPHNGDTERGVINVCIYNGDIHAAIYSSPHIQLFSPEKEYQNLPQNIQSWIAQIDREKRSNQQPDNVTWFKTKE